MRNLILAALVALGAAALARAATPPLHALVNYETEQRLASGITRTERWQERLVRQGDRVWSERLGAHAAEHEGGGAGHKHFDFDSAARWLERQANGELQLRFVATHQRQVVSVPKAEWGAVSFDGRWDAAAHLVPPGLIAQMKPLDRPSEEGIWREQREKGWTHRVLWSEQRQVALRVESVKDDGSYRRVVVLKPAAAPARAPWTGLDRFEQKVYDDFLD